MHEEQYICCYWKRKPIFVLSFLIPEVPVSATLGSRLAQARRELGVRERRDISQLDVAQAIGASSAAISRWESDLAVPREETLAKLAAYLGVTPALLRYGIQAMPDSAPEPERVRDPRLKQLPAPTRKDVPAATSKKKRA